MVTAADPEETRTSVWLTARPAAPARRRSEAPSGLDRERITAATVRLLDAEGLGRFSMRRLAAALGVTAMSLYWYVDTKHDLLELALDRALGELSLPATPEPEREPDPEPEREREPDPESRPESERESRAAAWPARLRALACGYRELLAVHPWVAPLTAAYPNIGPHARAFDAALQRLLDATGLADAGRTGAHLAVSHFLHGCGGSARRAPEGDFRLALDVLIAGIEAKTA
ncbi:MULTISPECIES: TetR/AcrR family transcriptional regulator [unclassified Streptomyces]|uniref:TetR/AcrR family transcriptional regulator n=1 Tax=unclassified Streptomyces TaxID=2593676 RepID=UPI002253C80E|nr:MULTISPECIES: TetR/AcrR family transcriptional regulator [unclassified Streptomyces]MCX4526715.1 TetR/AcrR family transcriptional regulator [Streptomyces sp. NBC_01551]MCX4542723.1 TetR/AcrR family transcriptional regulator [Streptomyces sp. NBC_01565]